jgi:intracellular sulfur oxidation DsrE/DsrF family protein
MLKFDSAVAGRLSDAQAAGIGIMACGNTMKGMKLTKDDLHPAAQVVKTGLLEIHDKQQKGWTYVRP